MSDEPIPRNAQGLQELGKRQRYKDMSDADKELHKRCLLVKTDENARGANRAIVWADDAARKAKWEKRGYTVAQDPYIEPAVTGKKKDVIVVKVPVNKLSVGGNQDGD